MGPEGGLEWQAIPSKMDDLFFPGMYHSTFGRGLVVIVSGAEANALEGPGKHFTVRFDEVEAFWAIEDKYYAALGGEMRTGSVLNRTDRSTALSRISPIWMQYEVLTTSDPIILHHEDETAALNVAREVLQ